ncbi:hypothetical protein GGF50DRAFT_130240 [Schizophyllum commune]
MSRHLRSSAAEEQQDASTASSFEDATQEHSRCIRPNKRKIEDSDNDADLTIIEQDATGPPNKRNRTEYTKHERFWFLDGNILLQLGDTRFQLYRGRLASQSPWLKALFEQHAGGEPEVNEDAPALETVTVKEEDGGEDGIVVYLDSTDVALEDFLELLTAMEDTLEYCSKKQPFPVHAAVFRAASSLRFDKFAEHAKKAMTGPPHGFPEDLASLTEVGRYYTVDAILLGRSWNVPEILKRAFYELARLPDSEDRRIPNPALDPPESGIDALDPIDLALLLNAQKKLAQAWTKVLLLHDLPRYKKCGDANCEASTTKYLYRAVHESGIGEEYALDPLCGLQALFNAKWVNSYHHCQTCAKRRKSELAEKRKELWASLDGWLDI